MICSSPDLEPNISYICPRKSTWSNTYGGVCQLAASNLIILEEVWIEVAFYHIWTRLLFCDLHWSWIFWHCCKDLFFHQ
jgi:hypothetical protein